MSMFMDSSKYTGGQHSKHRVEIIQEQNNPRYLEKDLNTVYFLLWNDPLGVNVALWREVTTLLSF